MYGKIELLANGSQRRMRRMMDICKVGSGVRFAASPLLSNSSGVSSSTVGFAMLNVRDEWRVLKARIRDIRKSFIYRVRRTTFARI